MPTQIKNKIVAIDDRSTIPPAYGSDQERRLLFQELRRTTRPAKRPDRSKRTSQ